jgi:hypothetical protein
MTKNLTNTKVPQPLRISLKTANPNVGGGGAVAQPFIRPNQMTAERWLGFFFLCFKIIIFYGQIK